MDRCNSPERSPAHLPERRRIAVLGRQSGDGPDHLVLGIGQRDIQPASARHRPATVGAAGLLHLRHGVSPVQSAIICSWSGGRTQYGVP